ncbi:hypothetical protein B9Z19DRAFT_574963 [Tuber borchii]|uniref:Uncharacterized protein n=1 Tax=Tuber borchii TaxID=42251 RepID=A0A2T6ZCD0_TUBBO|nr:hypothetical protein B9Z19DRAFT_574963 [Tuber borchii]
MAHISARQTFALLPPPPFPCGYFWDAEEIRHQEHLHRVSHAQLLYSRRTDSPEAMRVYKDFISEQNAWMAEQEELIEREAQVAMKAHIDRASRWAEEWRRLESGEAVEDVLMQTGATLITKSPFRLGDPVTCVDTDPVSPDDDSTPKSISTLNLPESLIDWRQSQSSWKGLQIFKLNCTPEQFPSSVQMDGTTATRIQNPVSDPAEITRELQQDLSRQILFKPLEKNNSRSSGVDTHSERNKFVVKPIISFPPPGLGPPKKSRAENFATSKLPPAMKSLIQRGIGLAGGEVIKICSHKRWTDDGDLLYEILWKPHDLDIPPLELWVKSGDFMDANKRAILDEYHQRNKLGIVHWRSRLKKKLRTSGSLGVKEIKDALDKRKRSLVASGRYDDRAVELLGKCRWVMRGEWQQRGRGWAAGIEVTERWKKAWQDADEAERIGHSPEREAAIGATANPDGNDISCLEEVEPKDVPFPAMARTSGSPSFKQLDGGHVIDLAHDLDSQWILGDNHKITRKDEEEWRGFFGGINHLDPVMADITDSSTIGGISEPGGVIGTFPKAVETWCIDHSESSTLEVRNTNKTKGEFVNLLKRDRFARKSKSEAISAPVSVQSVSGTGSCLVHEPETFFSRLLVKDRHQNNSADAVTTAAYKPILQLSEVTEIPGGFGRTPAIVSTPLDGETSERHLKSGYGMPQLNCTTTQEEARRDEASAQDLITGGTITGVVAIQVSPSTESLAESEAGQSGMASESTKIIGEQLDEDWPVRFLELFPHTLGLSNLLAGAYSGDCGPMQAAEYIYSPVASFRGGGGHISSLDGEEATDGGLGGNTEHRRESDSSLKKAKRELGFENDRDPNPPESVALPQEALSSQDGVSLLLTEVWSVHEVALTKHELAMQALNDSCERTKARGKELKSKKKEEELTREERREYRKLKKLLVQYRVTRWLLGKIGILVKRHRQEQRIRGASPSFVG